MTTSELQQQYDELVAAIVKAVPEIMDFRTIGFRFKFNEKIFDFDGDGKDRENKPWLTKPVCVCVSPKGLRGDSPWQTSDVREMHYMFRVEETGEVLQCKFVERQEEFRECLDAIGRPITLEDVLRAMHEHFRPTEEESRSPITRQLATELVLQQMMEVLKCWHLGHDLAWHGDNAPETIRFLHSLLCV